MAPGIQRLRNGVCAGLAALVLACGGGEGAAGPGGGAGGGGSGGEPPGGGGNGSGGGGGGSSPAGPQTVTVEMRGIAYQAIDGGTDVVIELGDRVRWVNRDGTLHTATSHAVPPGGKGFNRGHLPPGGEYVFLPNTTGIWEYGCLQYPDRMPLARITVVE